MRHGKALAMLAPAPFPSWRNLPAYVRAITRRRIPHLRPADRDDFVSDCVLEFVRSYRAQFAELPLKVTAQAMPREWRRMLRRACWRTFHERVQQWETDKQGRADYLAAALCGMARRTIGNRAQQATELRA